MSYRFFLLENLICHLLTMLWCLYNDWLRHLRHLDVVSANRGLSPCGLNPVFVLKRWPQDGVHWNKPSVNLLKYLFS